MPFLLRRPNTSKRGPTFGGLASIDHYYSVVVTYDPWWPRKRFTMSSIASFPDRRFRPIT